MARVQKKTFNNPDSAEREYTRLLLRFAAGLHRDVNTLLIPKLPLIKAQFDVVARTDTWTDTLDAEMADLRVRAQNETGIVVSRLPGQFMAISRFNERQFRMVAKANTGREIPAATTGAPGPAILGLNVFRTEPYLVPLAEGWIKANTDLIKSLPTQLHTNLEGIIRRGVMNGVSVKDLAGQIKDRYGVNNYRATLIAQDQTLKLNADLTRYRLQSVGVREYIWRTVQDNRVRPHHVERNGKTYAFDKPPAGGQHPGQEVRCRCRAEAVWPKEEEPAVTPVAPAQVTPPPVVPRRPRKPPTFRAIPPDDLMGEAPGFDYYSNTSTVQQNWHQASFVSAPLFLKKLVRRYADENLHIQRTSGRGAYYRRSDKTLNMGGYKQTDLDGQATWRHEYGHHVDYEKGKVSQTINFRTAFDKDRDLVLRTSAADDVADKLTDRYTAQTEKMTTFQAEQFFTERFNKAGVNFNDLIALLHKDTVLLNGVSAESRMFLLSRLLGALESGNVRRFATALLGGEKIRAFHLGNAGMFSDLIGSLTRNKVLGWKFGAGHSDSYYKLYENDAMEVFANFFSLYGGTTHRAWGQILKKFVPEMDKVFRSYT